MQEFSSDGVRLAYLDFAPERAGPRRADPAHPWFRLQSRRQLAVSPMGEDADQGRARTIVFDNRGHGRSEKLYDPAQYTPWIMARDAANLLDHLDIERADVMGYSMGARIAAHLAVCGAVKAAGACPRRAGRPSRGWRRPAHRHSRRHGGAVAGEPDRSDAAHVPRFRRGDQERPAGAGRLHARLAPRHERSGGRRRSRRRPWSASAPRTMSRATRQVWPKLMPNAAGLVIPGRDHNRAVGDKALQAGRAGVS